LDAGMPGGVLHPIETFAYKTRCDRHYPPRFTAMTAVAGSCPGNNWFVLMQQTDPTSSVSWSILRAAVSLSR
jgi:hypothetical protein